MTDYLLGKPDDIPEGRGRAFDAGGRIVAVFRGKGRFHAIANKCLHRGASMCDGVVADGGSTVRCPWHNWTFDLETGRNAVDPDIAMRVYKVRAEGDQLILTV
jgi:nitrite reductase/ring-hydroxylating ferredoxin subunit